MKGKSLLVYWISCLLCFYIPKVSHAQDSLEKPTTSVTKVYGDTTSKNVNEIILTAEQRKKRIRLVTVGNIAGYGGAMFALYNAWYKNYPQSNFHFFDDNAEWLQVDKVGHAWSAYMESKASMELWRWAGLPYKKRVWIGGLSGMAYQTVIETLDGFSAEWGWSWGDFAANCVGSGMLISQELLWKDQLIQFKWSFHTQRYGDKILNDRADSIYGTGFLSRMLKDYNAQTYWLSANIKSFFPKSNVPAWLNVAVGYGAEGMFGAMENKWKDAQGNKYDRTDIDRYRQWYLAPDIDLTKIKTKSKFLKTTLSLLNVFKFPTPSIGFSKKGVQFNWLHF
jgi:uncharacterized protein YfiM (DUF2279 family)